jgi:predicted amidophosphoribosyltransferase
MADAFPYVKYIEDGEAKHLGGGKSARYIFDSDFFRGKIVVLFDDVITTGRTLMDVKVALESLGAIVLCAVTLGVTRHRRRAYNQIEMIKYYKNNILL